MLHGFGIRRRVIFILEHSGVRLPETAPLPVIVRADLADITEGYARYRRPVCAACQVTLLSVEDSQIIILFKVHIPEGVVSLALGQKGIDLAGIKGSCACVEV